MVDILTPKADHEVLHPEVLYGILRQKDVEYKWFVLSRPKPILSIDGVMRTYTDSSSENKNSLREFITSDYVLWLDSDVVLTSDYDLHDLKDALDKNPEIDGFALDTKNIDVVERIEKGRHLVCACLIVRAKAAKETQWCARDMNNNPRCDCISYNNALKLKYLDNRKLREVER